MVSFMVPPSLVPDLAAGAADPVAVGPHTLAGGRLAAAILLVDDAVAVPVGPRPHAAIALLPAGAADPLAGHPDVRARGRFAADVDLVGHAVVVFVVDAADRTGVGIDRIGIRLG